MHYSLELETLCEEKDLEKLVHRCGNAMSEAVLESPCLSFRIPEIDGFIGYRLVSDCAIILGDPICAEEKKFELAEAFHCFALEHNMSYIYFIASQQFSKWAIEHTCKIMIQVGDEFLFNPQIDPCEGPRGNRLRNKISHARSHKLTVKEYTSYDPQIEESMHQVGKAWLKGRKGPQIYLGHLNFFQNREDRRWFYLQDKHQTIIGTALLSKLDAHQGWFLKFLIINPEVPRGTSELLMISILETLRQENCRYLTYGMVPSENLGEIIGLGKFAAWNAKKAFKIAKWFFSLAHRKIYWQKFHPQTTPSYLLFSNSSIGFQEMRALINTMKIDL